ncbi:MAG TPA: hypothetical protein VIV12_03970, partial [Streptosporangiaceae bacterium]
GAQMTQQYLIGELSVCLEQLQAAASQAAVRDVAHLRYEVETRPVAGLVPATARALALADALCWDCVNQGDAAAFARLAGVAAQLRCFGVCARLLPDH